MAAPLPVAVSAPVDPAGTARWRPVIGYVIIAVVLAWLVCLPAWFTGGINSPLFGLGATAMMLAPTIAALVATRVFEQRRFRSTTERPGVFRSLGVIPPRPILRWLGWIAAAWLLLLVLITGAFAVSAAFGTWVPDLTDFSYFRSYLVALGAQTGTTPIGVLVASQLINAAIFGSLINCVFTTGEEVGWRGYLYPRLLDLLPRPAALVLGGVIWGLWHAPVILLGYNYPSVAPWLGLLMMCGFTTFAGTILMWLRARSRSVWPAVVGHAVVNAMSSAVVITLSDTQHPVNTALGTPLGVTGWIVLGGAAVVLAVLWPRPAVPQAAQPAEAVVPQA